MDEKVSIIVPIYNAEKYLKECLDGIVGQTYTNVDVILVNDGSTDASETICLDYKEKYKYIHYYKTSNAGVSSARNFGIGKATGDWIFFVDADDAISTQAIEHLVRHLNEGIDWVVGAYSYERSGLGQGKSTELFFSKQIQKLILNSPNYKKLYRKYPVPFDDIVLMTVWGKLYKRSIIVENQISFYTDLKVCEDVVFNYEYARRCRKVLTTSDVIYYYRKNENSASMRVDESRIQNLEKLLEHMRKLRMDADDDIQHDIDVYCCKMIVIWMEKIARIHNVIIEDQYIELYREKSRWAFDNVRFNDWMSKGRFQKMKYAIYALLVENGMIKTALILTRVFSNVLYGQNLK